MLKKEGNGWTRGAEDVREGRREDGGEGCVKGEKRLGVCVLGGGGG